MAVQRPRSAPRPASILIRPLLSGVQDSVERGEALWCGKRNERRSAVRHARYQAEDRLCGVIADEMARAEGFDERLELARQSVQCWQSHFQRPIEDDIVTGLSEPPSR